MKILKVLLVVLSVTCLAACAVLTGWAQKREQGPVITDTKAEVVSVDADASVLVIRQHPAPGVKSYTDVPLNILPETGITRADEILELSDLKPGDKITVEYQTDIAAGESTAVSIYLEAGPDEPAEPGIDIIENE